MKTNLISPVCLSACNVPYIIQTKDHLVMRMKELIIYGKHPRLKATSLQGDYRDGLGEFGITSYVVFKGW